MSIFKVRFTQEHFSRDIQDLSRPFFNLASLASKAASLDAEMTDRKNVKIDRRCLKEKLNALAGPHLLMNQRNQRIVHQRGPGKISFNYLLLHFRVVFL